MALCNSCDLVCLRVGLMLLAAGSSSDFQTGLSTQEDQHTFQPCSSDLLRSSQVFAVAAGALHTLFFTTSTSNNTQVIGCGDNSRGQLLAGSQRVLPDPSILPISYPQDYSPAHVHASWQTSYFHLTSTNPSKSDILLSCGSNDFGELGTGSTGSYELAPKAVQLEVAWPHPDPFIIEKVSAGPRHVLALLASKLQSERKQLVGWGAARKGELGLDRTRAQTTPMALQFPNHDGSLVNHAHIQDFVALLHHSAVLFTSTEYSAPNVAIYGAPKLAGPDSCRFIDLAQAVGADHKLLNSSLHACWSTLTAHCPSSDGSSSKFLSIGANHLGQHGLPATADTQVLTVDEDVVDVVGGSEHTLILTRQQDHFKVLAWGWNEHGNLGLGHTENVFEPTSVWQSPPASSASSTQPRVFAGSGTSFIAL